MLILENILQYSYIFSVKKILKKINFLKFRRFFLELFYAEPASRLRYPS
jgi:hypothetical protein